jgi:nitrogen fixation NifU-like protein
MDLYRDELLDHYKNPHNFGEIVDPKISIEEYNPLCGDRICIQVKSDKGQVTEAGFTGEGCAISMAAASMLTDYIKGRSLQELKELDGTKVLEILNLSDISPARLKCALLSFEALKKVLVQVT